jgi:hypothetical protein
MCEKYFTLSLGIPKAGQGARKCWRRLRGFKQLAVAIQGVKFGCGVCANIKDGRAAA